MTTTSTGTGKGIPKWLIIMLVVLLVLAVVVIIIVLLRAKPTGYVPPRVDNKGNVVVPAKQGSVDYTHALNDTADLLTGWGKKLFGGSPDTTPTPPPFSQTAPIDCNGCDANNLDSNGFACDPSLPECCYSDVTKLGSDPSCS